MKSVLSAIEMTILGIYEIAKMSALPLAGLFILGSMAALVAK